MRAFYVAVALLVGTSFLIGLGELSGLLTGAAPVLLALLMSPALVADRDGATSGSR